MTYMTVTMHTIMNALISEYCPQVVYGDMLQSGECVLIRQPLLTAILGPDTQVCVEVQSSSPCLKCVLQQLNTPPQ